jgi:glycosyltransferase involved in cell wall biosynthesis
MQRILVPIIKRFNKEYVYQNDLFNNYLIRRSANYLRKSAPTDEIIAVDFVALSAVQRVRKDVLLLSLEIYPGDKYKKKCDLAALKAIIQPSQERYDYVFGKLDKRLFIVPNAPTYKEYDRVEPRERKGLIWPGTIDYKFGVHHAIQFLRVYTGYTLTLKGAFVRGAEARIRGEFGDLIKEGRLIIDADYFDNDSFIRYISSFKISFCFYDWAVIEQNINYWLAPAGRLFMSYSAGVPVIGCNTPGLRSITTFGAGVQIDDYSSETIKTAIDLISDNYEQYADAAIDAAKAHSFAESCLPLIEYLAH